MNLRPSLILPTILFVLLAFSSVACNAAPTPESTVTPALTTPLPALNPTEKAIVLASTLPTETPAPVPTLDPTQQAFVIANILPTPTSDGSPYPITWRVTPYTTYDGRTAYMVDDRQVLEKIKQDYIDGYTYTSFLSEFPEQTELKSKAETLFEPELAATFLSRMEDWRNKYGGYWRRSIPTEWDWSDEIAEFSADGSQVEVVLHLEADQIKGDWIDLKTGRVTQTQALPETLNTIVMHYDTQSGRWRGVSTDEHIVTK